MSGPNLEGVLERVTYANEENAWSVVKLVVPGRDETVTVVGNLLGVQSGESIRLTGRWVHDKKYGEQFRAESYVTVKPATLMGIEKYLGSGLVKGIGRGLAKRLVAHFGIETLEVIDTTPERLEEVEGIGPVRRSRIAAAWIDQRHIKDVMVFLQSHGVSPSFAVRIYRQYRDRSIAIVKENPYQLALDIMGIGFKTADKIASALGIAPTSEARARAGVLHSLGESSTEGHVFLPRSLLLEHARNLLEIDDSIIEPAIDALAAQGELIVEQEAMRGSERVYLRSLHAAEEGLAAALLGLVRAPVRPIEIDVERALTWFEGEQTITLAPEQRAAIGAAVSAKILVITGGPGTGKTTLVNGIIRILEKKGRRILLAAPTGRAAKRMTETTGREARTIHRLLEIDPKTRSFSRNRERPLEADILIVDEASMIDVVLAYSLLKGVPPLCQLIFVGDVDQLPSVGPGSVLQEVIRSGVAEVVRLAQIFRQKDSSLIVVNAHRINQGQFPIVPPRIAQQKEESNEVSSEDSGPGASDFYFINRKGPEEVLETLIEVVQKRIPRSFGLDPISDVQVLTPMHRGLLGAGNLNAELQTLLNPSGPALTRGGRIFRVGDKVMQIRNNYDLEVFNGDIGRVHAVDDEEQTVSVDFDGRLVTYDTTDLDELVLAYACSIHKSQGSEYPCVVLPLHTQHYVMLQRNLVYTGITRGKRLVVIVGSKRALAIAIKNDRVDARFTRLAGRLTDRLANRGTNSSE